MKPRSASRTALVGLFLQCKFGFSNEHGVLQLSQFLTGISIPQKLLVALLSEGAEIDIAVSDIWQQILVIGSPQLLKRSSGLSRPPIMAPSPDSMALLLAAPIKLEAK